MYDFENIKAKLYKVVINESIEQELKKEKLFLVIKFSLS